MRIIKLATGFLYYQKIFHQLHKNQCKIVLWQFMPDSGKREISNTHIDSYNLDSGKICLKINSETNIVHHLPIYFYAEDGQIIFKTNIESLQDRTLSLKVPEELKLLEDPEINYVRGAVGQGGSDVWKVKSLNPGTNIIPSNVMRVKSMAQRSSRDQDLLNNEFEPVNSDEEDKLFAGKRESPRARPRLEKYVKIARIVGQGPKRYKLFDLSRGGMGFLVLELEEFQKGDDIQVIGFNDFDLDDPFLGKVMSIRPIDEQELQFKVGVKFTEGQD